MKCPTCLRAKVSFRRDVRSYDSALPEILVDLSLIHI